MKLKIELTGKNGSSSRGLEVEWDDGYFDELWSRLINTVDTFEKERKTTPKESCPNCFAGRTGSCCD